MDLTSPKAIAEIRKKFDFAFKKGLGQNFLTSPEVLDDIVSAAQIENGVLEIGPGFGVLTAALAKTEKRVVAVEIDERLLPILDYTLAEFDNVKIINGDIMRMDAARLINEEFGGKKISVAANLPYYITTPILTMLIESRLPISNIVVMVQKEVAERICADAGSKIYGAISVMCQYYTDAEIITDVPASLFVPPPKVDSAVLRLKVRDTPSVEACDERLFFRIVRAAFSQRRKTLCNCLSQAFSIPKPELSELLNGIGINPQRRGETLTPNDFGIVCGALAEKI